VCAAAHFSLTSNLRFRFETSPGEFLSKSNLNFSQQTRCQSQVQEAHETTVLVLSEVNIENPVWHVDWNEHIGGNCSRNLLFQSASSQICCTMRPIQLWFSDQLGVRGVTSLDITNIDETEHNSIEHQPEHRVNISLKRGTNQFPKFLILIIKDGLRPMITPELRVACTNEQEHITLLSTLQFWSKDMCNLCGNGCEEAVSEL
jgi:hypothetical protein